MTRRSRPTLRTLGLAAGLIVVAGFLVRLASLWPDPTLHPEVRTALERSLEDQKVLARLDPEQEARRRATFDSTSRLLGRIQILEHNRDVIIGRYRLLLLGLASVFVLATLVVSRSRRRRLEIRLERVRGALEDLVREKRPVGLAGEARHRDIVGRIARMIEETSERVARDHRRLASLENLAAWQEAARRHAHEMRTPLTGARLELERLRDRARLSVLDADEVPTVTESVLEELDRLRTFVEAFTSFAKLPHPRLRSVDAERLLERWAETYSEAWPRLRLEVSETPPEPTFIRADPDMLREVLVNLAENAAEAGASRIRLAVSVELDTVRFSVADDGPGIAANVLPRLFEPYSTTREVGQGMGLGLAISRKILLDHGGELLLARSGDDGSVFHLVLPSATEPPA